MSVNDLGNVVLSETRGADQADRTSKIKAPGESAPTAGDGTEKIGLVPPTICAGYLCGGRRHLLFFYLHNRRETGDTTGGRIVICAYARGSVGALGRGAGRLCRWIERLLVLGDRGRFGGRHLWWAIVGRGDGKCNGIGSCNIGIRAGTVGLCGRTFGGNHRAVGVSVHSVNGERVWDCLKRVWLRWIEW